MSVYYKGNRITSEGVTNYNQLDGKPSINGQTLQGDMIVGSKVTLNGSEVNDPSFYAPTASGTAGQVLKSKGAGQAPEWVNGGGGSRAIYYATCTTGGNIANKEVTISDFDLTLGCRVVVKFGSANTVDNPKLYINGGETIGDIIIRPGGSGSVRWQNDETVDMFYDGGSFVIASMNGIVEQYGTCSTGDTTVGKTVEIPGFMLYTGARATILFSSAHNSTSAATLNINGTGAKTMRRNGSNITSDLTWGSGELIDVVYDGTYWQVLNHIERDFGSCSTAVGTTEKAVTIPGFKLVKGAKVHVSFTNPHISGTAATLNVSSTGGKTIRRYGMNITTNNGTSWMANDLVTLVYDGTYWQIAETSNIPVGTIAMFGGGTIPAGWLKCDGTLYSTSTYAKLYAVIGTTYGSGTNQFKVPNFLQRFPQGAGNGSLVGATPGLGTYTSPGIPDIYGVVGQLETWNAVNSGAFYNAEQVAGAGAGSGADNFKNYYFRASKGEVPSTGSTSVKNNVYGKSATVQPASLAVHFMIRYA